VRGDGIFRWPSLADCHDSEGSHLSRFRVVRASQLLREVTVTELATVVIRRVGFLTFEDFLRHSHGLAGLTRLDQLLSLSEAGRGRRLRRRRPIQLNTPTLGCVGFLGLSLGP
jgi:hypothetical protein